MFISNNGEERGINKVEEEFLLLGDFIYWCPSCACYHIREEDWSAIDQALEKFHVDNQES